MRAPLRTVSIAVAALALAASTGQAADADLAAEWHLDTATPQGVTGDSSGNGRDGTLEFGAAIVPGGRFGAALDPAETQSKSSAVRVPYDPGSGVLEPPRVTVLAWVRAAANPGDFRYVVAKGAEGCSGSSYAISTGLNGQLRFFVRDITTAHVSPLAGAGIWDGKWHAVAGTFDGATVRLYVDGSQVGAGTPSASPIAYALQTRDLTIGTYPAAGACESDFSFPGQIDEARIYRRALTATEIAYLHRPDHATPPQLPAPVTQPQPQPQPPRLDPPPWPRIVPEPGRPGTYGCEPGRWRNLPALPGVTTFRYTWLRRTTAAYAVGGTRLTTVATGQTFTPRGGAYTTALKGGSFYVCRVEARNAAGTGPPAYSRAVLLTPTERPITLPRNYGNLRIRGIDVLQVTQPTSGAPVFGFPSGAFPDLPGGGTPTDLASLGGLFGCGSVSGPRQTAAYRGVTLDRTKPATAVVYYDVEGAEPAEPGQPLEVKLSLMDGARAIREIRVPASAPRRSDCPAVSAAERADGRFGVRIPLPAEWLLTSGLLGLTRSTIDLRATVRFASASARRFGLRECDRPGCETDNAYRLSDVAINPTLPPLIVQPLTLARSGQGRFRRAQTVLRDVYALFPGGERLDVRLSAATLDITAATDVVVGAPQWCKAKTGETAAQTTRSCRQAGVDAALWAWTFTNNGRTRLPSPLPSLRFYDLVLGIHDYAASPGGSTEPGWSSQVGLDNLPDVAYWTELPNGLRSLGPQPMFTANARTRPKTAAAHEFGHQFGAPHADLVCSGDGDGVAGPDQNGGQVGEAWAPDNRGRLQGVAHDPRTGSLQIDGVGGNQLYDLMSYCASEAASWVSPFNWNRYSEALLAFGRRLSERDEVVATLASAPAPLPLSTATSPFSTATSGPRGTSPAAALRAAAIMAAGGGRRLVAAGVAGADPGDGGAVTLTRSLDPGEPLPADVPSSPLRLRSRAADGRLLLDVGVAVRLPSERRGRLGSFVGAVAPGAAVLELVRGAETLGRLSRGRAPTVRVAAPRTGARIRAGRPLAVRWRVSDPDTRARTATVDLSLDGGRSWRTAFSGADRGRATIPAGELAGSRRARVRVAVNDGLNEVLASSGRFRIDLRPPTVTIQRPVVRERLRTGRNVLLGAARDDRGRPLTGRALTWYAGRRRLGSGERLRTRGLPPGRVTLRLVARARGGISATRRLRVRVVTEAPRLTRLDAPAYVRRSTRRVAIRVAAAQRASLSIAGRRTRIGPRARRLVIPLARSPRSGIVRIRFTLRGAGGSARGVFELLRG